MWEKFLNEQYVFVITVYMTEPKTSVRYNQQKKKTMDYIKRCNSIFGHIARMSSSTPVHQALCCHFDWSLGRLPDKLWLYGNREDVYTSHG